MNRTLKPAVEREERFVLLCDNLEGQKADRFKDAENDGISWYGLVNATDIWQPEFIIIYIFLSYKFISGTYHPRNILYPCAEIMGPHT